MNELTLEALAKRVEALEQKLAERPHDWRRAVGISEDNEFTRSVRDEIAAVRELEREVARAGYTEPEVVLELLNAQKLALAALGSVPGTANLAELVRTCFGACVARFAPPDANPVDVCAASAEADAGQLTPHAEVFDRLRNRG